MLPSMSTFLLLLLMYHGDLQPHPLFLDALLVISSYLGQHLSCYGEGINRALCYVFLVGRGLDGWLKPVIRCSDVAIVFDHEIAIGSTVPCQIAPAIQITIRYYV